MRATEKPASVSSLWLPYLFDIVAPFVACLVVHAFGARAFWALAAGGAVAGASTALNSIRRKGLDGVGVLVVLEIAASIALLVFVRDARLLLIRPSFYTGLAAVYLMVSAFIGRPLSYAGSRPMAAKGGPARLAAYERAWERSAEFRRTHCLVTFGFGLGLAADSILRVLIVYNTPVERAAWLSNVPHVTAIILIIGVSALAGRRFAKLVDEQMEGDVAPPA
jgi:hypothetical protein